MIIRYEITVRLNQSAVCRLTKFINMLHERVDKLKNMTQSITKSFQIQTTEFNLESTIGFKND